MKDIRKVTKSDLIAVNSLLFDTHKYYYECWTELLHDKAYVAARHVEGKLDKINIALRSVTEVLQLEGWIK